MKLKKLLISFFTLMMMCMSFSTNSIGANNNDEDNTKTIYTTTNCDMETLGREVGKLLANPDIDQVRVIYTDLLHINQRKNYVDNKNIFSTNGWSVEFSCPYPPYEKGPLPIARATGRPGGIIQLSQTKSVEVSLNGKFSIGIDELGAEYGKSLTENQSITLSYTQTVPKDCISMTVEAYPEYEVHHFISYYNGKKDGSGTIKYPIGVIYDEIHVYE